MACWSLLTTEAACGLARLTACAAGTAMTLTGGGGRDRLGGVHLDFRRLGNIGLLHIASLGASTSILGTTGGGLGAGGTMLGLTGSSFGSRLEGEFGEQNTLLDHLGVCGANDDEDEQNNGIDDHGQDNGRFVLPAGIENAKVGKLHAPGADRVCLAEAALA